MDLVLRVREAVTAEDVDKVKLKACQDGNGLLLSENVLKFNLNKCSFPKILNPASIVTLDLKGCKLNYLPDDLRDLPLKELDVSDNAFEEVPKCIRDGLKFLQILNFSHNKLRFFDAPQSMVKLRVLKLNNNNLTDIPEWILNVYALNLEEFYYSHNCISSLKKSKFYYTPMYRLNKLELRSCELRNVDFQYLKSIRTLTYLDMSNDSPTKFMNNFMSNDLSQLLNLPSWSKSLKVLYLDHLHISDLPVEISNLSLLEELHLRHNDLFWLPKSFFVPNLRVLDISHNRMTVLPSNLSKMLNLRILRLEGNLLDTLQHLPAQLEELDVYDNILESYCDNENSLIKLDVEMNYFDTSTLGDYDRYLEMKTALRDAGGLCRCDGSKTRSVVKDEEESDKCSEDDSNSSAHENHDLGEGTVEEPDDEESWDYGHPKVVGDVGCSSSDNEFNGYEESVVQSVRVRGEDSDWKFVDVSNDECL